MAGANPLLNILKDLDPETTWREISLDLLTPGFHFPFIEPGSKQGLILLGKFLNRLFESCQRHRYIPVFGAGDGNRTRDVQLGKLAFYR